MEFISSLGKAFVSSEAIWMFVILAAQITSIAIMVERSVALFMRRSLNQKAVAKIISDEIESGNLERAMKRAQSYGNRHPIATVALAGMQAATDMGGKEEIQLRMDEILLEESSRVEKRIGFLSMFANVATLMGLLGTVSGLIQSFAGIANANPAQKSIILSEGISTAMNTTAYGLIVAVPALIMYAVLQNRANRLTDDLNKSALRIFISLTCKYDTVPSRRKFSVK